jgi:hypothetical protein
MSPIDRSLLKQKQAERTWLIIKIITTGNY